MPSSHTNLSTQFFAFIYSLRYLFLIVCIIFGLYFLCDTLSFQYSAISWNNAVIILQVNLHLSVYNNAFLKLDMIKYSMILKKIYNEKYRILPRVSYLNLNLDVNQFLGDTVGPDSSWQHSISCLWFSSVALLPTHSFIQSPVLSSPPDFSPKLWRPPRGHFQAVSIDYLR